jgi:uncharacterized membrane protein YdjX (TVP38/TMEM64 family)
VHSAAVRWPWSAPSLAGLVASGLARTAARLPAERLIERRPKLARLHELLGRRGFSAVLAARLMPGIPATGLHYAAGVSPVRAREFLRAAAAAIVLGGLATTILVRQLRRPATP